MASGDSNHRTTRSAGAWFHTLVVVGASLSACGGDVEREPTQPHSGGKSTGEAGAGHSGGAAGNSVGGAANPKSPSDCRNEAQFTCSDYAALSDCRCDPNAPASPAACASPFAFHCREYFPPSVISPTPHFVECECSDTYLVPEDCASPTQFICAESGPLLANCACDPSLPTSQGACGAAELWRCQSIDPLFGCHCECCRIR